MDAARSVEAPPDFGARDPRRRRGAADGSSGGGYKLIGALLLLAFSALVLAGGLSLLPAPDDDANTSNVTAEEVLDEATSEPNASEDAGSGSDPDTGVTVVQGADPRRENATTDETEPNVTEMNVSEVAVGIYREVNRRRGNNSLTPLRSDGDLSRVAMNHSRNMSESGYVGHTDPSGEGVERYRYECRQISGFGNFSYSENLAKSWYGRRGVFPDGHTEMVDAEDEVVRNVVGSWMDSEAHRTRLLRSEWGSTGVGVALNDSGAVYVAQVFCTG